MTLVIVTTSFTLALREPALSARAASHHIVSAARGDAALTAHHRQRPTPCQKSTLPGTVNACPLANFSFNGMAVTTADLPTTTGLNAARWTFGDTSRPAQCLGLSPYRPPCATA